MTETQEASDLFERSDFEFMTAMVRAQRTTGTTVAPGAPQWVLLLVPGTATDLVFAEFVDVPYEVVGLPGEAYDESRDVTPRDPVSYTVQVPSRTGWRQLTFDACCVVPVRLLVGAYLLTEERGPPVSSVCDRGFDVTECSRVIRRWVVDRVDGDLTDPKNQPVVRVTGDNLEGGRWVAWGGVLGVQLP